MNKEFDYTKADSQSTNVSMISPEKFDREKYAAYAEACESKCLNFMKADEGLMVYRRFRVADVLCFVFHLKLFFIMIKREGGGTVFERRP